MIDMGSYDDFKKRDNPGKNLKPPKHVFRAFGSRTLEEQDDLALAIIEKRDRMEEEGRYKKIGEREYIYWLPGEEY